MQHVALGLFVIAIVTVQLHGPHCTIIMLSLSSFLKYVAKVNEIIEI